MSHNLLRLAVLSLFAAAVPLAEAQGPAPTVRPAQHYAAFLQGQYATLKRYIIASAEKMPADRYAFKPVPEVMTYAGLFGHIIDTQYFYCNAVKGGDNPADGKKLDTLTDKTALVPAISEAFAYCDGVFAAVTNDNALEVLTASAAPTRARWFAPRSSRWSSRTATSTTAIS